MESVTNIVLLDTMKKMENASNVHLAAKYVKIQPNVKYARALPNSMEANVSISARKNKSMLMECV